MSEEQKTRAELIAEFQQQPKPDLGPSSDPWTNGPSARPGTASGTFNSLAELGRPLAKATRWQYAIVNLGTFNNADRMRTALATAGGAGWELVTIYDKSSNWVGSWEKGFMLLKRSVPDDVTPATWCLLIRG